MNESPGLKHFISRENTAMTRASCLRKIDEIITLCDKVPIAKMLSIILRKRGEVQNDPHFWSDKSLLKKLEQYEREFSSSYNPESGEFDLNEVYEG